MTETTTTSLAEVPEGLLDARGTDRLHIGGTEGKEGWKVFNAVPADYVDFVGDLRDMSRFDDASFDVIYASHVLEHLGYKKDLPDVLSSLARILRPRGRLLVSVPNFETLCRLFFHPDNRPEDRFLVMRMVFGAQVDSYDFHCVGLTGEFFAAFLSEAGFSEIYEVHGFGLFKDQSSMTFHGVPISLNMVAVR